MARTEQPSYKTSSKFLLARKVNDFCLMVQVSKTFFPSTARITYSSYSYFDMWDMSWHSYCLNSKTPKPYKDGVLQDDDFTWICSCLLLLVTRLASGLPKRAKIILTTWGSALFLAPKQPGQQHQILDKKPHRSEYTTYLFSDTTINNRKYMRNLSSLLLYQKWGEVASRLHLYLHPVIHTASCVFCVLSMFISYSYSVFLFPKRNLSFQDP